MRDAVGEHKPTLFFRLYYRGGILLTDRSAVSTTRGYFYQFDASILSILDLAEATERRGN